MQELGLKEDTLSWYFEPEDASTNAPPKFQNSHMQLTCCGGVSFQTETFGAVKTYSTVSSSSTPKRTLMGSWYSINPSAGRQTP
jgi:hypothetical protein